MKYRVKEIKRKKEPRYKRRSYVKLYGDDEVYQVLRTGDPLQGEVALRYVLVDERRTRNVIVSEDQIHEEVVKLDGVFFAHLPEEK